MRSIKNEQGTVLVFVALMIVLLLIMVGMGLDTGQLTYTRSQGQSAVDAAALAAVSGLPVSSFGNEDQVIARVAAFNSSNDYLKSSLNAIGSANITYIQYNETSGAIADLPSITNANGVRVALEQKNPYTGAVAGTGITAPVFLTPLVRLFGLTAPATTNVNVSAVAALKATPGVPIAIMNKVCNGSNPVNDVKLRDTSVLQDNACWTTYTANPPSPSHVRELFHANASCSGLPANTDSITTGTSIELDDNTTTSTYSEAKALFITSKPGRCWIVPVIPDSNNCKSQDQIIAWAKICPTAVVDSGSNKHIKVNLTCSQDLFRVSDNLCFSPRLLRDTKSGM